jgi:hypothetical protein
MRNITNVSEEHAAFIFSAKLCKADGFIVCV